MEVKLAQFTNKGMNKDLSISKSSNEFVYNNENIRITTIGKESLLSVTNERKATITPIGEITKDIPVNWFRYSGIRNIKDNPNDTNEYNYYLEFKSDYNFKSDVQFDVTMQYYKQEGLDLMKRHPGHPIWYSHKLYIITKRYTYLDEDTNKTYYIWQLDLESDNSDKIYIINEEKDYISLTDTIYVKCDDDDPDKSINIGSAWYKDRSIESQPTEIHFLVECFNMHGHDDDIDRFDFVETPRSHTFTLTAQTGYSSFKYKVKDLPDLVDLLPGHPQSVDDWGWGTGYDFGYEFMRQSDMSVTNTYMEYTDSYFHYTTDKNKTYPPTRVDNIQGDYVGHCVCNNYIVLFVKYDGLDYIYKIYKDDDIYTSKLLFKGGLKLSIDKPIETLFYYESEDIQKVYWLDGINQTRVINIMKDDYINDDSSQFDFVPNIRKIPSVSIIKEYKALGNFHSGVIQFFLTYYNKFGAETKIVYSSPLNYISFEDRAGSADEFCSCSFNITISNIDTKFDYLRIYSAKRQSINGPIEFNIVSDIKIADRESINIVDTGANQVALDSNMIYFLGGVNFVAETFAQKDDVLFLGNISLKDSVVDPNLKDYIRNNWITDGEIKEANHITFDYKCFTDAEPSGYYPFKQQINYSSITFKSFKFGEIYRFGIQYLEKSGTWTQPIWIGDKKCDIHPGKHNEKNHTRVPTAKFALTSSELLDNSDYINYTKDYIKYRIVMAKTDYDSRSVVAQGLVCPTIFNYNQRLNNDPYAISSYIMRPRNSNIESRHFYPVQEIFGTNKYTLDNLTVEKVNVDSSNSMKCYAEFTFKMTTPYFFPIWEYELNIRLYLKYKDLNDVWHTTGCIKSGAGYATYSLRDAYTDCVIRGLSQLGSEYNSDDPNVNKLITRDNVNNMSTDSIASSSVVQQQWRKKDDYSGIWPWRIYYREFDITYNDGLYQYYEKYCSTDKTDKEDIIKDYRKEYYVDESILTLNSPELSINANQINNNNLKFRLVGISPITSSKSNFNIEIDPNTFSYGTSSILNTPSVYNIENISSSSYTLLNDYLFKGPIYNGTTNVGSDNYNIYMWHFDGSLVGNDNVDVLNKKIFSTMRFSMYSEYFANPVNMEISTIEISNGSSNTLNKIDITTQKASYIGGYKNTFIPDESGTVIPRETDNYTKKKTTGSVFINYDCLPHAVFSLLSIKKIDDKNRKILSLLPLLTSDSKFDDITHMSFEKNTVPYDFDYYPGQDNGSFIWKCAGIVNLNKQSISEFMEDLTGLYDCVMTSYSDSNSTDIKINEVYKIYHKDDTDYYIKLESPEMHSYQIYNQGLYKNLQRFTIDGSLIVYYLNKYEMRLVDGNHINNYYYRPNKINYSCSYPYLFIGELYREIPYNTLYGGYDDNALENTVWIPICGTYNILAPIDKMEGDTYYQRWDCVKTLPADLNDVNQVIDITSVMLESHYCLDGRYDKNRIYTDLLNINANNYNLYNDVYSQSNNIFSYNLLDDKYDLDIFKNLVIWSNQKLPTDDIDTWTNISQLNSLYLNGEYGGVNKLVNFNDTIVAFQDKAIAGIKFNNNIQISTENGSPIELVNSNKVTGYDYISTTNGCLNKWSINEAAGGLYFIDSLNKAIFRFNKDGLTNLSASLGFADWSTDNISLNTWKINSDAFRTSSDKIKHDVYFINKDKCLCYNENTQTFTSFYTDYKNIAAIFNLNGKTFYLDKNLYLNEMFTGDYKRDFSIEFNVNPEPLEDKIFTNIEYIADTIDNNTLITSNPFKKLEVKTEYQEGETNLLNNNYPNSATKFRIWGADVPRDKTNILDRIRNPWARFKLIGNDSINGMTTLHSLVVKYFK